MLQRWLRSSDFGRFFGVVDNLWYKTCQQPYPFSARGRLSTDSKLAHQSNARRYPVNLGDVFQQAVTIALSRCHRNWKL